MNNRKTIWHIISGIVLLVVLCLVVFYVWYSGYKKSCADQLVLKSRYTYSIDIDTSGKAVNANNVKEGSVIDTDFSSIPVETIAQVWTENFLNQFTPSYLPWKKALKKITIDDPTVLDRENNTILVRFSAQKKDPTSEFFSSWNGIIDDDLMKCEWVITFDLENNGDGTATIYVTAVTTPEDYGIAQYNSKIKDNVSKEKETSSKNVLTGYEIKNSTLYVTYDGGEKYITVPVENGNLPLQQNNNSKLKEGSYQVNTSKTAFLYGGITDSNNKKIPLTLIYSDDKGTNWITSEIDQIYDADYYYVNFFDDKNGVVVVGYGKGKASESSKIFVTSDGGENWTISGSGPATNVIKGVIFIDENTGFFCYDYVEGMDSNLYMTKDAGKTFSKVTLEAQELDSTAANSQTVETTTAQENVSDTPEEETTTAAKLEWNDVYKEALVPVYDSTQNTIVIYLTQGSNGVYNNGKTAAKYQSTDKGSTWKYIGQLEISTN